MAWLAVLLIVAVSVLPMVVEYLRHRRRANAIVGEIAEEIGEAAEDIIDPPEAADDVVDPARGERR